MTTRVDVSQDKTPVSWCPTCGSPVDIEGRTAAGGYIHMIEGECDRYIERARVVMRALEPFAQFARLVPDDVADAVMVAQQRDATITIGDVRRALALVNEGAASVRTGARVGG